ncbi:MAG: intradiol ring-cleavage dioxygenase [Myxococcota bacterium]
MRPRFSRRNLLSGAVLALLAAPVAGCGRFLRWVVRADNSGFDPVSYSFETSDLCALNAEAIRGPFYVPGTLVRRSIAEGHAGAPLRVRFRVVDVAGCRPLEGMAVEIWHCDAKGAYSGYPSYPPDEFPRVQPEGFYEPEDDERFCRGVQFSDAGGFVEFETIVPGWYTPRTPHIHVRVSTPGSSELAPDDERLVLTNQVYFPDELIARIFAGEAPYTERGPSPYTNANDFVIHESGGADGGFLRMSRDGRWHVATLTLGVPA